jgi:DNA-binding HxlR family transcriptional regulator
MAGAQRSDCPFDLGFELLGDRWRAIVLRGVMFGGRSRSLGCCRGTLT